MKLEIFPIPGIPEVRPGMDLAREILLALDATHERVRDGDVFAVAQKIVSKAEGRLRYLPDILPGPAARELAAKHDKDPRVIELVLSESRRLVRAADGVIITETHHGLVCANAGVDRSNAAHPTRSSYSPLTPTLPPRGSARTSCGGPELGSPSSSPTRSGAPGVKVRRTSRSACRGYPRS